MEDSGHSQELQNPNMELKAYLLDWRLKDRDGKDLDNFEDVVPRVDKAGVPQESNSFSSMIGGNIRASELLASAPIRAISKSRCGITMAIAPTNRQ